MRRIGLLLVVLLAITTAACTKGGDDLQSAIAKYTKKHDPRVALLVVKADGGMQISTSSETYDYIAGTWVRTATFQVMDWMPYSFDVTTVKAKSFQEVRDAFARHGHKDARLVFVERNGSDIPAQYNIGSLGDSPPMSATATAALTLEYEPIGWDLSSSDGFTGAWAALLPKCPDNVTRVQLYGNRLTCWANREYAAVSTTSNPHRGKADRGVSSAQTALPITTVDAGRLWGARARLAKEQGVTVDEVNWIWADDGQGPALSLTYRTDRGPVNCKLTDPCSDPV